MVVPPVHAINVCDRVCILKNEALKKKKNFKNIKCLKKWTYAIDQKHNTQFPHIDSDCI